MKIKPFGERVLIKTIKQTEERTKSGLYLPKSKDEKKEGTVIEVGTDKNGRVLPLVRGDRIIYGGYSQEEIEIDGEKYLIVEFKDIVAKVEN
jgi:chaperonin GroES